MVKPSPLCLHRSGLNVMIRVVAAAAALLPRAAFADAQALPAPATVSLEAAPVVSVPAGSSADLFAIGGGGAMSAAYAFPGPLQPLLCGSIGYAFVPTAAQTSVSILRGEAGAGALLWLTPRFGLSARLTGGFWYGAMNGGGVSSGSATLHASAGLQYLFLPGMDVGIRAGYRYDMGLYQGVDVIAATTFHLTGAEQRGAIIRMSNESRSGGPGPRTPEKGRGIQLGTILLEDVFPVFYKFYDDHPVGSVTLVNREKTDITDVGMTFFVKQYMDSAKPCLAQARIPAGGSLDARVLSLFTDRILEVTETTKVAADVTLDYTMDGVRYREARTVTLRILNRNAMTWGDTRKAAAFVTARDPAVMAFSKAVAGSVRDKGTEAFGPNLAPAMGIFEALEAYGLSYVVDPATPFELYSAQAADVDFLQFPRQTLAYKGGDCDDLSILCAALLQSVAVPTAFITTPGHIFIAFHTGLDAAEAVRAFSGTRDLIVVDGKAWIPVEVTVRRGGFLKAWQTGARE